LENRVFDYAIKQTEGKVESAPEKRKEPVQPERMINNSIPEMRPNNLPMVEKSQPQNISELPINNYTPKPTVVINNEPVQMPISVPRFKAVPMSEIESGQDFIPNIAPKPNASGIMDAKLNSVTKGMTEVKPEEKIQKNYAVDPYREPLK
jgi:hypothetical protein